MESNNINIDNLIIQFLTNDISERELTVLENWKSESEENLRNFNQQVQLWYHSSSLHLFDCINPLEDWKKVEARMNNSKQTAKVIKGSFHISKIAAILLPLIIVGSIGFSLYWNVSGFGRWETAKSNQITKEVILPDSSHVILNTNTSIKYLVHFNQSEQRLINLKGEAFFKVSHNKNKPFIVKTDQVEVQVLGTEFNVNNKKSEAAVSVISGKVQVKGANNSKALLTKGDKATYSNGLLKKEHTITKNDIFWCTGYLEFHQATLNEICIALKNAFPEILELKNTSSPSKIKLTTSFKNQSLKDIIEELHIHFGKKFTFDGKVLTISD